VCVGSQLQLNPRRPIPVAGASVEPVCVVRDYRAGVFDSDLGAATHVRRTVLVTLLRRFTAASPSASIRSQRLLPFSRI